MLRKLKINQLVKDSVYSLIGSFVGRGLGLAAGIVIARLLGKDVFGEYGIIKTTILTVGAFSTYGLGYTATKYVAELKRSNESRIPAFLKVANIITILFSGVIAIMLFIFSKYVAIELMGQSSLEKPLKILSLIVVFNAVSTTQLGVMSGFGCFNIIAKINSWMGVITFLLSSILTYYFLLVGALLSLFIIQLISCIVSFIFINNEMRSIGYREQADKKLFLEVIYFSTPIALQEASYSFSGWVASLLMVKMSGYGELGMYTAAAQWYAIVLFIPGILRNVALSHLSKKNSNYREHSGVLKQIIVINVLSTLALVCIIAPFSILIEGFYGESFGGLGMLIILSILIALFTSVSNVYSQAYMSLSKNWLMFYFKLTREILKIVFFIFFIKVFSLSGALSMIVSGLLCGFLYVVLMALTYRYLIVSSGLKIRSIVNVEK